MRYVTQSHLAGSIRTMVDYRRAADRFLDTLFTYLVLKRLDVQPGALTPLTIGVFTSVCRDLLLVVRAGDPTSSYGEQLYNVFGSRRTSPLVRHDWPRSTLWTRYARQGWNGILHAQRNNGSLSWRLEPNYVPTLLAKLPRPLPVFALACMLFRRPSDVPGLAEFDDHEQLVEALRGYFHITPAENPVFDFAVPEGTPPLGEAELTREEVIRLVADNDAAPELARRLAAEAGGGADFADQIVACLHEMGQVLLSGPPGTGKSHWAIVAALRMVGCPDDYEAAVASGRMRMVAWHPSTAYEDFVRGVEVTAGNVTPRAGLFQNFCDEARGSQEPHVLIIDEINRANPVAVLGDLLFGLDITKRGMEIQLADGSLFSVPTNMYIIATANTADRSIAALDAALGRRFARLEVAPASGTLGDVVVSGYRLADVLDRLNAAVLQAFDREHRIGHSYFMNEFGRPLESVDQLIFAFRYRVIPLLQDYCLDDFGVLDSILGGGFVNVETQTIRETAFASEEAFRNALAGIPGLTIAPLA